MLRNISVEDNKVTVYLDKLVPGIISKVKAELNFQAKEMRDFVREAYLTGGPGDHRLRVRSRTLVRSLGLIKAETNWASTKSANSIVAGIHVGGGVPYARVHINKPGTVTTIHGKPWLTVPQLGGPAYKKSLGQGAAKYSRSIDYPHLVYMVIRGQPALVAGKIGTRGKLVPLKAMGKGGRGVRVVYWLKRSVQVRARVHPEWIVKLRRKFIYSGIKGAVASAIANKK
jgi:hypothetical protein